MKPKDFASQVAAVILASTLGPTALAQNIQPTPIELGVTQEGRLDESVPRRSSNHAFTCYGINTKPGEDVSIHVTSAAFDPVLEVARGALCNASSLQFENDNANDATKDAQVSFRAAGGRYLILVRGVSPSSRGAYRLKIAGSADSLDAAQVAESDEAQRRRHIMAMEVEKRNAEIAAAEAKRQAALAEQARLAALQSEQTRYDSNGRASRGEEVPNNYQPPSGNLLEVFTTTFMNEYAASQQREEAARRNIEDAIRRGEAEYHRRMAAERAQEAQERQDLAMRQAAAQRAQAEQAQRLAEERARAAQEATRRIQLAQAQNVSAPRTSDRVVAYPSGGQSTPSSSSSREEHASTRNDPATCVSGPTLVKNPNCPKGAGSLITNQCTHSIDARICHWTTQGRWDCGVTSASPGQTRGYPSCYGTGRMWMDVRYSDSRTKFSDPP